MKKKWKIFLSVFVLLLLVAGGTIYYFFEMKEYDVADEKVEEIIDTEYDIVLPGDEETDSSVADSKGQTDTASGDNGSNPSSSSSENGSKPDDASNPNNQNGDNTGTSSEKAASTENTITVAAIKDKYRPSFENLQNQANGKIDTLVNAAYNEYKVKKQNGESISFSYFYQKYTGAGKALEDKTDAAFQIIYKALQEDLQKNNFSTSHAKDFLTEYEAAKTARESALLNKAKEAL